MIGDDFGAAGELGWQVAGGLDLRWMEQRGDAC